MLWNVADRTEIWQHDLAGVQPFSVQFSPDGQLLALGMRDHTIRLLEVPSGREWATLTGHRSGVGSAPFSPDGMTLASVADDEVKLWNVATLREVATCFRDHSLMRFCAFAGDGQALVSASWHGTVRILRAPPLAEIDRAP